MPLTLGVISNKNVEKLSSKQGRGIQMNTGASVANGEILIFLHADTILPKNVFSMIKQEFSQDKCVAGSFALGICSDKIIFKMLAKMITFRSKLTRVPYGDQTIFVKADFFKKIGGFKEIKIMEDIEFMRQIKKSKAKTCIISEKIYTSPRRWEKEGILRCVFRNWVIRILYYIGIHPDKLVKFYKPYQI